MVQGLEDKCPVQNPGVTGQESRKDVSLEVFPDLGTHFLVGLRDLYLDPFGLLRPFVRGT